MKKLIFILVASIVSFAANAADTNMSRTLSPKYLNNTEKANQLGVGLEVGSVPGLNLEYWLTNATALEGSVSLGYANTELSIAHLWFYRGSMGPSDVAPYIGIGALGGFGSNSDYFDRNSTAYQSAWAVQVPLGLEFLPPKQRFSLFGEVAPSVEVTPIGAGFITADIGAKFYF